MGSHKRMGSPIKRLCQLKNTSPMKLRLLFWQALRVASCNRAVGRTASVRENLVWLAPWPKAGKLDGSECCRIVWSFRAPVISQDVSSPSRKRTSHPSGLRRMERDLLSGPWLSFSPRKSSVPDRVQERGSQISGSPPQGGPNPGWFTAWALPSHSSDSTSKEVDGTVANQIWWLLTNPNRGFAVPAILSDQSTSPPRRGLGHASRNNTLAPTCGPPPSALLHLRSWPACADKTGGSPDCGEWQNGPPR